MAGEEDLVLAAASGDESAWAGLVQRYSGLIWAIARGHRLNTADAADVSQTTWLRLVEHLSVIRDPSSVGAWIATTTRRECLSTLRRSGRQFPVGGDQEIEPLAQEPQESHLDERLIKSEENAVLWAAFDRLGDRCRLLLRILMADPPASYEEISATLDMPLGSIGPTRARCLDSLRKHVAALGISGLTDSSL